MGGEYLVMSDCESHTVVWLNYCEVVIVGVSKFR